MPFHAVYLRFRGKSGRLLSPLRRRCLDQPQATAEAPGKGTPWPPTLHRIPRCQRRSLGGPAPPGPTAKPAAGADRPARGNKEQRLTPSGPDLRPSASSADRLSAARVNPLGRSVQPGPGPTGTVAKPAAGPGDRRRRAGRRSARHDASPFKVPSMKSLESSPAARIFSSARSSSLNADDDRFEPALGSPTRRQVSRRTQAILVPLPSPSDRSRGPMAGLDPLLRRQQREASRGPGGGNEPPGRRHDAGEIRHGGPRPQPSASPSLSGAAQPPTSG